MSVAAAALREESVRVASAGRAQGEATRRSESLTGGDDEEEGLR